LKILYIGSSGSLSLTPLRALIEAKHSVCAFAFDQEPGVLDVIKSDSIQSLAFENTIPFIKFDKNYTNAVSQIQTYQPDIILVSCYARLLPQAILSTVKNGCFNVHPSLLPAFRGPAPIFWQYQQGVTYFGVTLHRLSQDFDTGNSVSQMSVKIEDGFTQNKTTELLAKVASDLVLNLLDDIKNNRVTEIEQDKTKASYYSYPDYKDYELSTNWTAKRIYNFIKAYQNEDVYFLCQINKEKVKIINAISFQHLPYNEMNGEKVIQHGDNIKFSCQAGYIDCQIKLD